MAAPAEHSLALPRPAMWIVLGAALALMVAYHYPYHLDEYDEAKQAFASYDMLTFNHWLLQYAPDGTVATKPPLLGWISAGLYRLTGSWLVAWRLPSLLATLLLLAGLLRDGERRLRGGGFLAAAAFALCYFSQRMGVMVRTDMLLALCVYMAGAEILLKVRSQEPWSVADRARLALWVLLALMTKGPVAYAFLVPGLLAYAWITRGSDGNRVLGCGFWPWLAPFAVFLLWVGSSLLLNPDFYGQVVVREFAGRFMPGVEDAPKAQPFWYYLPNLIGKFLPWSLLLIWLLCLKPVRGVFRTQPDALWLACWILGGLCFMSLIPSKRADRIFPTIPPLCLLIPILLRAAPDGARFRLNLRRWMLVLVAAALAGQAVNTGIRIHKALTQHQARLIEFGEQVRQWAEREGLRTAILRRVAFETGLVLYTRQVDVVSPEEAVDQWRAGTLPALVLQENDLNLLRAGLGSFRILLDSDPYAGREGRHYLIVHPTATP